jgi:twitching motility protein PilT
MYMHNGDEYLRSIALPGTSDIHFKVGRPPLLRINGLLAPREGFEPLTPEDTEELAIHFLGARLIEKLRDQPEIDTAYSVPGFSRFRLSVFQQRGSISMVLRIIPFRIPTLEELKVPPVVGEIAMAPRGLVLVTGVTGSGKSSTLAAMIGHINERRSGHIITIEDPIEFLHADKLSAINQREIGVDTASFTVAFRAALRQDPDVILIGELRDTETMEIALRAAETGHLVVSTVHTTDARETIGRIIDMFPPYAQQQVRLQLAANLRAVISQRLLDRADGQGRALAAEVMVVNATIRDYICQPDKVHEITASIARGREQYGMQTFDQAIMDLWESKVVTEEEAIRKATSPNDFKLKLKLGNR